MKLFSLLYRRAMAWSRHPHASWYLGGMSFAESSFFPVPPDVMLAPMCLANPQRAWRLAPGRVRPPLRAAARNGSIRGAGNFYF